MGFKKYLGKSRFDRKGAFYDVGLGSNRNVSEDPWIPTLFSTDPVIKPDPTLLSTDLPSRVGDLMDLDLRGWRRSLLQAIFPPNLMREILQIKIPISEEFDRLV